MATSRFSRVLALRGPTRTATRPGRSCTAVATCSYMLQLNSTNTACAAHRNPGRSAASNATCLLCWIFDNGHRQRPADMVNTVRVGRVPCTPRQHSETCAIELHLLSYCRLLLAPAAAAPSNALATHCEALQLTILAAPQRAREMLFIREGHSCKR
jgi:hypothetical protein